MSNKAFDWAWTQPVRGTRQHVLLALAKRARPKTEQASPSMPELVEMTGLSESTIRAHIQALGESGIIRVEVSNGGRHKRSTYTLLVPAGFKNGSLTPQLSGGKEQAETPQQLDRSEGETPQLLAENPPTAGPVVLRTKGGTRGRSTSDAVASADPQSGLFAVEPTAPVQAGRSLVVRERKELAQANAGTATAAWVDAYTAKHDAKPTGRQTGQVARECRQLLEAGNPPDRVVYAASKAGERGFCTVEREYNALAKRTGVTQPAAYQAPRASTTDTRVANGLALAAKYARQEAG